MAGGCAVGFYEFAASGGDGGNGELVTQTVPVTPGQVIKVGVGAGGYIGRDSKGSNYGTYSNIGATSGRDGESSYFGSYKAAGGGGGERGIYLYNTNDNGNTYNRLDGSDGVPDGKGAKGGDGSLYSGPYIGTSDDSWADNYRKATSGKNGWVYIEYEVIEYEHIISEEYRTTIDQAATDKVKPIVLEAYLNGIQGNKDEYELKIIGQDYGTTYEHYITGINKIVSDEGLRSNTVTSEVISDVKGYSWKIDTNSTGDPDEIIGNDTKGNAEKELPKTIATSELNKGYYLHIRAIDNAGNVGDTVHLKLEPTTIRLTSNYNKYTDSNGYYDVEEIPLTWENSNKNAKFVYSLFQKEESQTAWSQVSVKYEDFVKVLNVYPNAGNNLKKWMDDYGQPYIHVREVSIDDYNKDPYGWLKKDGEYQYDVIMFGSWDYNNHKDLTTLSAKATQEFIDSGRGVLFGHDTFLARGGEYHTNLNSLAWNVGAQPTGYKDNIGSTKVKVVKKDYLTKFPYDIENKRLTIPHSHTSGITVKEEMIRMKFVDSSGNLIGGARNYYLVAWNNCAYIRTGHMNGAATPDEQKIIANVLFYLGQVTDGTSAQVHTVADEAAPEITSVKISENKEQNKFKLNIQGIDHGTGYDHYVVGTNLSENGQYHSNTVHTTVTTGIQKFEYTINNSKTTYGELNQKIAAENKESCIINIPKSSSIQYLHIRPVDVAGNAGKVITIPIDSSRTISKEEKDETEELYCIDINVEIPALDDGTTRDATVNAGNLRETVTWALEQPLQKLFEIYIYM